ncbi:hypothetical protein [Thermoactinomyces mirandus]|uniref:Uncharacterized protein n=1 Tax=Thermoactinomyces mirandus TaxID=2756294 RepID=A0A7W2AT80_9BACL|nr:hypothetical protein [Thermoactinomyces mirandus]MBA4603470.1 hypothetical protein [Thermoactinomyces mirandus]
MKFACCQYKPMPFLPFGNSRSSRHPPDWGAMGEKVVFCGGCDEEMTFQEYVNDSGSCPACYAKTDAGCKKLALLLF